MALRVVVAVAVLVPLVWFTLVPAAVGLFSRPAGAGPGALLPTGPHLVPVQGPLTTPRGLLTVSSAGVTRTPLVVALGKGRGRSPLWRLSSAVPKAVTGWQAAGPYLLVQAALSPTGGDAP